MVGVFQQFLAISANMLNAISMFSTHTITKIINRGCMGRTKLHMYMYVQYLKKNQQQTQEIIKISKEI